MPAGRETNPARLIAVWRHVVTSTTPPLSHAAMVAASGTKARPFHTLRVGVVSKHHVFPVVGEAILAQFGVALSQVVVAKMLGATAGIAKGSWRMKSCVCAAPKVKPGAERTSV